MRQFKLVLSGDRPVMEGLEDGEVARNVSLSFRSVAYAEPNVPGPGLVRFTLTAPGKDDQVIEFDYSL